MFDHDLYDAPNADFQGLKTIVVKFVKTCTNRNPFDPPASVQSIM